MISLELYRDPIEKRMTEIVEKLSGKIMGGRLSKRAV
jgi:hypothetical protein